MAAILPDRQLSPRAYRSATVFPAAVRINARRVSFLSDMSRAVWRALAEWLALLWMLGVVAFSLLMTAGALGFLA